MQDIVDEIAVAGRPQRSVTDCFVFERRLRLKLLSEDSYSSHQLIQVDDYRIVAL